MTISLDTLTSDPTGSENGLVTRNIPSGIQVVEVTDGYGNILGTTSNPINVISSGLNRVETMFTATGISGSISISGSCCHGPCLAGRW